MPIRLSTLLYPSGPENDPTRLHLFVVLTDPFGPANQVLMVPVCSVGTKAYDTTCVLAAGEHTFIKHESYVAYARCRVEEAAMLDRGVQNGQLVDKGPVSEALYEKILAGLRKSKFTKPFALNFLDDIKREKTRRQ